MVFLFGHQEMAWDKENNDYFGPTITNRIVNLDGYHKQIFNIGVENKNDIEYDVIDGWILTNEIVVANERVKIGLFPYSSITKCLGLKVEAGLSSVYFMDDNMKEGALTKAWIKESQSSRLNYKIYIKKDSSAFVKNWNEVKLENAVDLCEQGIGMGEIVKIVFQEPKIMGQRKIETKSIYNHYMWQEKVKLIVPRPDQGLSLYLDNSDQIGEKGFVDYLPEDPFLVSFFSEEAKRYFRTNNGEEIEVDGVKFLPFFAVRDYTLSGEKLCSKFSGVCVFDIKKYTINTSLKKEGKIFIMPFEYQMVDGDAFEEVKDGNLVNFKKGRDRVPASEWYIINFGWVQMEVANALWNKKSNVKIVEKDGKKYLEKGNFFIQGKSLCEIESIGDKKALGCVSKVDLIK